MSASGGAPIGTLSPIITSPNGFITGYSVPHITNLWQFPVSAMSLVFRNGLFMTPGYDYDITGNYFIFRSGAIHTSDFVAVVDVNGAVTGALNQERRG